MSKPWHLLPNAGAHKFRIGQRVRPSQYGKDRCIFPRTRWDQTGVVTKVDRWNWPTVLWEGRKIPKSYFPGFVEPDRRRPARSLPPPFAMERE